ncbi:biopolymer transporter ExbD [Opitutaceae bacterium EW11]|nr:biopolymer transporter ExbD [Opitutaceae bacterium EW11]
MSGSSGGSSGGKKKARIEIIPLIDVIFFLLATFVLFTLSLNKSNGINVPLPKSETSEPRDPANSVTITVTQEGTLAWDKDPISLEEFITRLQAYKQTEPNPKVLINGDENALFAQARYVFDEVRKAGIQKVLIETRIRPPGEQ